ncbi:hypothetical protein [Mycobacterium xenopi]|uniref:Uncharacterized protein n=2 Tax=Mycobacterium xenopi TaxID=1789 RepID=A0AAD1H352_MYCXE|nr:hypothetical protein [Mycobacterium xenopi]EUA06709.1 hypothetical protein I553_0152 [Mycobacterium xenopi 4042]EUA19544.1 hypothetical protein I552_9287 [Mycobacterium xenopi 3993]EID14000.1 hypothetical protein MXEN_09969 [Mycobacterium xenopi RIVM700367]MDA3638508.1 hypothetical protein [Mycobacterium xenopi]MDA3656787.1 hypothetical protein [Mycobacterium xenopi]
MADVEKILRVDEAPEADALDQHHTVDAGDEVVLDTDYVSNISERDANEADVIDQATIVPLPDDDLDGQA